MIINLTQALYYAEGFLGLSTQQKTLEHVLRGWKSRDLTEETLNI